MERDSLIKAIYDAVPVTYKGLTPIGEHIVQLHCDNITHYATLEKLATRTLAKIAKQMRVQILETEIA